MSDVYKAIAAVMGHMAKEGISKGRRNQQQGYNFRGIDDIYNALGKVLADNGLLMLPRVVDSQREERQSAKGGLLMYTILTVEFDLVSADDGSTHMVRMIGEAMDSADKSSNKAQSAALKYAALQVFMIPTEGDNDADATTHEVVPQRQAAKKLTGKHKTKAALQAAWGDIRKALEDAGRDGERAAVDKVLAQYQDDIAQIKEEASPSWWENSDWGLAVLIENAYAATSKTYYEDDEGGIVGFDPKREDASWHDVGT